jgi:hypothetical protein
MTAGCDYRRCTAETGPTITITRGREDARFCCLRHAGWWALEQADERGEPMSVQDRMNALLDHHRPSGV